MARRSDRLQAQLEALAAADPATEAGQAELAEALASASCHRVARAARIVGEASLDALLPALIDALPRLYRDAVRRDPGCGVKAEIVEALVQCRYPHPEPFLQGICWRQLEPSWGPPVDTATSLRARSAMGLVSISWPRTPVHLADLLHDPEVPCRAAAARGLAAWGDPVLAAALVHLRLGCGEREGEVISECLDALLELDAEAHLPWILGHLEGEDALLAECAALSLGASRRDEALQPLRRFVASRALASERRVGIVAVGLLRSSASIELLLGWLEQGGPSDAEAALEGLRIHAHDPQVAARVRSCAERGGHAELLGPEWG